MGNACRIGNEKVEGVGIRADAQEYPSIAYLSQSYPTLTTTFTYREVEDSGVSVGML
jgi:hypothetical protein